MDNKELIKLAIDVSQNSYSPYSNFRVGASLLTKSGKIYIGTNVENSSFSPTVCAERVAIFKAISEGEKEFEKIVIVGGENGDFSNYCSPCGVCRQVISEFCDNDFKIILGNKDLEYKEYTLNDMLPNVFKL